jgi:CheY-like chemotaxis protein
MRGGDALIAILRVVQRMDSATRGSILLVEDEPTLLKLSETILVRQGFTVSACADAEAALNLLHAGHQFDMLATDMTLPGMNGVELAHLFRALQPTSPILLMSGHDESEIIEAGGVPEPSMILLKPVGLADMRAAVDELLG